MDKKTSSSWLKRLLAVILPVLILMALVMWAVDPFYNYRAYDHRYKLDEQFSTPGLVKNWDYDALIIGSSMAQNFDADSFRRELGVEPLKATTGGMTNTDIVKLLALAQESGHASRYYICIDTSTISQPFQESHYPEHLMDHSLLNDYKYWFSYEAWTRYIPLDLALMGADLLGVGLPQRWTDTRSIDTMSGWAYRSSFGSDLVLEYYAQSQNAAAVAVDVRQLGADPLACCDAFLSQLDLSQGEYVFFFPPYSALFWYDLEQQGTLDQFLEVKDHFIAQVSAYDNVQVFDFQGADFTADLDNYMDLSHYAPEINDLMVESFARGGYQVSPQDGPSTRGQIDENIGLMLERYPEILELSSGQ